MRFGTWKLRSLLILQSALILGSILLTGIANAADYTSSLYMIKDPVLAPAGYATSSSYSMTVTIGQPSIGTSTATVGSVRELRSGFEYFPFVNRPVPTATPGNSQVTVSWASVTGFLGWTVSGYSVGQSTTSGGPYSFTSAGISTSATMVGLANGTAYYFVVAAKDFFGNFIATSTEVTATPVAGTTPPVIPPSSGGGGGYIIPPRPTPTTTPIVTPPIIPIIIPPLTIPPSGRCHSVADLNCDGYVDIVDFSIMYYWFDQTNPPTRVDLSRDGVIDLADFSVMAYYWYERT